MKLFTELKDSEQIAACIPHWEWAVKNKGFKYSGINEPGEILRATECPCCTNRMTPSCLGRIKVKCETCPIYRFTGQTSCDGTPYYEYGNEPSVKTAQAMVDWLRDT